MSVIPLDRIKESLRIIHASDDAMLQRHLDASEDEAVRFMNRKQLPTLPQDYPPLSDMAGAALPEVVATDANVAPSVFSAVCLLVQAKYDATTPADIAALRKCAESLLMPYRVQMGV